jgi:biopolymer transport protein ExbD
MSVRLDHAGDALGPIHEINVTRFIDVMLVLLIIFMIAAPLATVDVSVDLPTSNVERQPRPDQPIFLTVKSDLTLALGDASSRGKVESQYLVGSFSPLGHSISSHSLVGLLFR